MSMPIQRQSESYGYFDEGPRFARDRASSDLPRGLAGVINSMGPRITGGMLNTRTAVNVDGMDDHAYHTELPSGPGGDWIGDEDGYRAPRREWNPDSGYEPTDEDERRSELVGEDDASEYNWGPEPYDPHLDGHPEQAPDYGVEDPSFGEYDKPLNDWEHETESRQASRHPFDREAFASAPPVPGASSYSLGHRVGTDWRDRTIRGTVIGLDGPQVAVRWDDGQHSNEEPHNIHLL